MQLILTISSKNGNSLVSCALSKINCRKSNAIVFASGHIKMKEMINQNGIILILLAKPIPENWGDNKLNENILLFWVSQECPETLEFKGQSR